MTLLQRFIASPRAFGLFVFLLAAFPLFQLLAYDARVVWGALYGIPLAVLAAFGLTCAVLPPVRLAHGDAKHEGAPNVEVGASSALPARPLSWLFGLGLGGAILTVVLGALFGQAGVSAGFILMALAFVALGASGSRASERARELSGATLSFGFAVLILFPFLGEYGLWDPWETHYGEVAREILARNDWISLWWAQDHFFFSKPVLIFWMEALSMSALGVDPLPDANPARLELAIRLPTAILSLIAVMLVQCAVARFYGARGGVVTAITLLTLPHFTLLARQAITDMPLVACVMAALALLALAFGEGESGGRLRTVHLGRHEFSAKHLLLFFISLLVLPQALYLIGLNFQYGPLGSGSEGFGWTSDRFLFGSAGNADMTGNPEHRMMSPSVSLRVGPVDLAQPFFQGLLHLALLGVALRSIAREESRRGLLLMGFYLFCALAFMAKGLPGIALPGVAALFYLIVTRRFSLLFRGELRIARGMLIIGIVSLPWYLAMCVRHGMSFLNRLLIHDHINRLAAGVHGDQGAIGYFLEQLGAATFPFTGLLIVALGAALFSRERGEERGRGRSDLLLVFTLFFFGSFTLFNAMVTKFHHYIFPAVPPLGVLFAVHFERYLGPKRSTPRKEILGSLLASLGALLLALGMAGMIGDPRGILPEGEEGVDAIFDRALPLPITLSLFVGSISSFFFAQRFLGEPRDGQDNASLAIGALLATSILGMVGRDLSWATDARPYGYERLIQLFIYLYKRPFPDHLDYRPIFTGFAVAASIVSLGLASKRLRAMASRAFLGLALGFALFVNGAYMRDLSDHWSQRPLFDRYYALRNEGDLIGAWQMNWKGENLYTGNRIHVFIHADEAMREVIEEAKGASVYFVLEHTRLERFRQRVGGREVEELTTLRDCNKFILVRVRGGPLEREPR